MSTDNITRMPTRQAAHRLAHLAEQARRESWSTGVELACSFLDEAHENPDERTLKDDGREGRPQDNVVYAMIRNLRDLQDETAVVAFCAVLTDFIVSAASSGGGPDVSALERDARNPVPQRHEANRPI